ncbi:MAG: hypothetical protein HQK66_13215, partial [Desulfamplus sp.]|nr:hypothetical protein [Desulfamplus sp.]
MDIETLINIVMILFFFVITMIAQIVKYLYKKKTGDDKKKTGDGTKPKRSWFPFVQKLKDQFREFIDELERQVAEQKKVADGKRAAGQNKASQSEFHHERDHDHVPENELTGLLSELSPGHAYETVKRTGKETGKGVGTVRSVPDDMKSVHTSEDIRRREELKS